MYRLLSKRALVWAMTSLALVACHNTQRDNPLDPQLTAAVELQVALDDTSATAMLSWTPYAGDAPFAAYWVLRSRPRQTDVDTLARIDAIEQMTFVDSTLKPDTEYDYRISSINTSDYEKTSQTQRIRPITLPSVHIEELRFDSRTASAALSWTPYRGPRFRAYQILGMVQIQVTLNVCEENP